MSRRAPWSLRRRLVLGVAAVLAVLAVVIGVLSTAALHDGLVAGLDAQLKASAVRSGSLNGNGDAPGSAAGEGTPRTTFPTAPASGGSGTGSGENGNDNRGFGVGGFLRSICSETATSNPNTPSPIRAFLPGEGAGAVGLVVCDGTTRRAGYLDDFDRTKALTASQRTSLRAVMANGNPTTVSLGKLGDYRVLSNDLGHGTVLVIGLPMAAVEATTTQQIVILSVVAPLAIILAIVLGMIAVGIALRPLTRVASTATRVSDMPLEAGDVLLTVRVPDADSAPTTEVGRVGAALNRLLERVQSALTARNASEAKLRRFVADASHELRTPLASIRGYAELSQRIDADLPPDVQRSLERIGSESIRMTALVEDLLLLARLDAGDRLRSEPVELPRLLVDAVSDAHAAAPDHVWELDSPDEDIRVLGDPDRLHQVVANLLANARAHTPSGTRVVVELSATDDEVTIGVRDNGPGIPPELVPNLFERFVRGDSSRSRNAGSTGLGLSIASAIVDAHGGRIDVRSEPGDTLFTVTLPRDPHVA